MLSAVLHKFFPIKSDDLNAFPREVWLENTLKKLPSGLRILDAGAGEQSKKQYCTHLDYVSQDFAQYDGKGNGEGLQTASWDQNSLDIVSDITDIPEADESFDAIMCIEVFEHLPDPLAALDEFYRLLKPNGYLIITAPFASFTHFAPYYFSTGFSKYWYTYWLDKKKFAIEELIPNGNFSSFLLQELNRIPYICKTYMEREKISRIDKIILHMALYLLSKMLLSDKKSDELCCFGYHCLARKQ